MSRTPNFAIFPSAGSRRAGYTLVEILVSTALTLILMTAVVTVFGGVGDGISKARRAMEQNDRLRTAVQQLRLDLQGVTVKMDGRPVRPEEGEGYLEYIEGGALNSPQAWNDSTNAADMAVGQHGDILMMTVHNSARPFVGRYPFGQNGILQSDVAEVIWFLRGTTLHRRVLLVAPGVAQNPNFAKQSPSTYYQFNDISARLVNGQIVPNSLVDLTKRENRFAHTGTTTYPFEARGWGVLAMPTLAECSSPTWMANWKTGSTPPASPGPTLQKLDYWDPNSANSIPKAFNLPAGTTLDQYLAQDGTRLSDDVVLTNVIGFDIKVWEPAPNKPNNGSPGYVDLGWGNVGPIQYTTYVTSTTNRFPQGPADPRFQHLGIYAQNTKYSLAATTAYPQRVYDTGCFGYENEGIYHLNSSGAVTLPPDVQGNSTNGLNDYEGTLGNVVDNLGELITCLPYPVPVRGMQITVRCFEPDSRQIRQMTIEQDFLPQ
jgi:type II secretory pathway pseudopilin PulG